MTVSRSKLSPLYAIADPTLLAAHALDLRPFAESLRTAGVSTLQLRDKTGAPQAILQAAAILREIFPPQATLILNDRADLALLSHFDGVHVGQQDLSPADVRIVSRHHPAFLIGLSTHTEAQLRAADLSPADYIAIGPIFPTSSKSDASPVVGVDAIKRARALTAKPLVAIGGITRQNCRSVRDAGADSVAVISGLLRPGETVENIARDFLDILR